MKKYFLGFDLATVSTGWSIACVENGKVVSLQSGTIAADKNLPLPRRLSILQYQVRSVKGLFPLQPILFKEQPLHLFKNMNISGAMFKAHGVVEAEFSEFKMVEISPSMVKKTVAGKGYATKEEVEQGVRGWLDLPETFFFSTDDESDAAGILLTGLHMLKMICKPLETVYD